MNDRPSKWMAETAFDCFDTKGKKIRVTARIGQPYLEPKEGALGAFGCCAVSLTPLTAPRQAGGINEFQALCLAIEFIRKALKTFVAQGGRVFYPKTKLPIDLDDPSFCPMPDFSVRPQKKMNIKKAPGKLPKSNRLTR